MLNALSKITFWSFIKRKIRFGKNTGGAKKIFAGRGGVGEGWCP